MVDFAERFASEQERLRGIGTPNLRDKINAALETIGQGGAPGSESFQDILGGITGGRVGQELGLDKAILENLGAEQQLDIRERGAVVDEEREQRLQDEQDQKVLDDELARGDAAATLLVKMTKGLPPSQILAVSREAARLNSGRDIAGIKQGTKLFQQAIVNLGLDREVTRDIGPLTTVVGPTGEPIRERAQEAVGGIVPPTTTLTGPIAADVGVPPAVTQEPILPEDIDIALGTGFSGAIGTAINKVTDFFGAGLAFPSVTEATEALRDLGINTKIVLQAQVPGRPSNLLLQEFGKIQVEPGKLLTGRAESLSRLAQTRNFIATELNRIDTDVLSNPTAFLPKEISDTRVNRSQLARLLEAYDQVLQRTAAEPVDLNQFLNAR